MVLPIILFLLAFLLRALLLAHCSRQGIGCESERSPGIMASATGLGLALIVSNVLAVVSFILFAIRIQHPWYIEIPLGLLGYGFFYWELPMILLAVHGAEYSHFTELSTTIREINTIPVMTNEYDSEFVKKMIFFGRLFYTNGFLVSSNQPPAFYNASQNLSDDTVRKTYIALPVYFALRYGLANSGFKSLNEVRTALSRLYPTLHPDVLDDLLSKWHEVDSSVLDDLVYEHFDKFGVFKEVFEVGTDVRKWFKSFLNQTYSYVLADRDHHWETKVKDYRLWQENMREKNLLSKQATTR